MFSARILTNVKQQRTTAAGVLRATIGKDLFTAPVPLDSLGMVSAVQISTNVKF